MPTYFRLLNLIFVTFLAIIYFTEMLGPEEEGKISHVTEIEVSERAIGKKVEDPEKEPPVMVSFMKLFKD